MDKLQSKKIVISTLITLGCIMVGIWLFLAWHELKNKKIDISDYSIFTASDNCLYAVDEVVLNDSDGMINGWLIKKGEDIGAISIKVLLYEQDSNQCVAFPTKIVKREDVTSHFDDGKNYDYSGYYARITSIGSKLQLRNREYTLMFLVNSNGEEFIFNTERSIDTWIQ